MAKVYTPEIERMSPEKDHFNRKCHLPTINFQGMCLFSGGYCFLKEVILIRQTSCWQIMDGWGLSNACLLDRYKNGEGHYQMGIFHRTQKELAD